MDSIQQLKIFQRKKKEWEEAREKHCVSTNFCHILQQLSLDHKNKSGKTRFEKGIRVQSSNNGYAHSEITVVNFLHHDNW